MSYIRKADFYYGALLSVLINNGMAPAIIEPGESRRIYSISMDRGEYIIYAKYVSSPLKRKDPSTKLWQFSFTPEEVEEIKKYDENSNQYRFAFICGKHDKMQESEIAILTLGQLKDCLDIGYTQDSYRISIKSVRGAHGLRVYGTGRADILNSQDNTIKVPRELVSKI